MIMLLEFDKHTALGAKNSFVNAVATVPFVSQAMAKAVCFQVSEEILNFVPQLDDYLCPICCSISWKPVRLKCLHVFCIRCMVVMQRRRDKYCPLCREEVLMEADEGE